MPFEISPTKLVYGGEALGHAQGRTVLVGGVLPGERAEVEIYRESKGVAHARPIRIIQSAPERVVPPCPYFGVCGGCHYQHLNPETQSKWKIEILRETLRRIGKIQWEADVRVHESEPWYYRNQAELKIAPGSLGTPEIGFFQAESHRIVDIEECRILSPRLNHVLKFFREPERLRKLAAFQAVELLADAQDNIVAVTLKGAADRGQSEALASEMLVEIESVVSVTVNDGTSAQTFGDAMIEYAVGGFRYTVSSGSFFQASRFLIADLVNATTAGCGGALSIDLYAGVGLFSLALARQFERVIAVESNPAAARDLERNSQTAGAKNIRVAAESAYDFLRRFAQPGADLVVLDPPRTGMGMQTLDLLAKLRPKEIRYVSCHPPTWARDLSALTTRGYRLESVEMFDLFPQTYHIEALARLGLA